MSKDGSRLATVVQKRGIPRIELWHLADWPFSDQQLLGPPEGSRGKGSPSSGIAYISTDSSSFVIYDPKDVPGSYFRLQRIGTNTPGSWLEIVRGDEVERLILFPRVARLCPSSYPETFRMEVAGCHSFVHSRA